jgi:FtsP/CotA-like multicopper oxidase with cupredoxin domain
MKNKLWLPFSLALMLCLGSPPLRGATIDDAADLMTQQAQEKDELNEMRKEMNDIKSTIRESQSGMEQLRNRAAHPATMQEVHLIAREGPWEVLPGIGANCLTYNGQLPGPVIRVEENQPVRVVVHNQLKYPTSMSFHGMALPHAVSGLPRRDAGLVAPGQTYAFQFVAPPAGTYWYHPQVVHADQMERGMYGAIISEPVNAPKTYERDVVLMLGRVNAANRTYFVVNGKSAPAIPPIEVRQGERIRLRIVNASDAVCPLYLTGHRFEVVSCNGSDSLEPHITRDSLAVQPGDRYDVEFTANNPGVWSLASIVPAQTNNDGKFPGGIAIVVRYPESLK